MRKILAGFLDVIEFFVSTSAVAILIYLLVTQPHQVNGKSMDPNFHHGEFLLTDKLSYRFRDPERGEVVVFSAPPSAHCPVGINCDFIKRVVALPGERIKISDNRIYIDGKLLSEPYQASQITAPGERESSYLKDGVEQVVPDDSYIVLGDNRVASSDSRDWGPVNKAKIVGRVMIRYWPPTAAGVLASEKPQLK